jgi:hypothetical protein
VFVSRGPGCEGAVVEFVVDWTPRVAADGVCERKEYAPDVEGRRGEEVSSTFMVAEGGDVRARSCWRSALLCEIRALSAECSFRVSWSWRRSC